MEFTKYTPDEAKHLEELMAESFALSSVKTEAAPASQKADGLFKEWQKLKRADPVAAAKFYAEHKVAMTAWAAAQDDPEQHAAGDGKALFEQWKNLKRTDPVAAARFYAAHKVTMTQWAAKQG